MKNNLKLIICIVISLVIGISGTYAWMKWQSEKTNITVSIENVDIIYNAGTNITASLVPTYTKEGGVSKEMSVYKTNAKYDVAVTFYLDLKTMPTAFQDRTFKWEMYKEGTLIKNGNFSNAKEGDTIKITSPQIVETSSTKYTLYLWIDANYENNPEMLNKTFSFDVYAESTNNPEDVLLANNIEPNVPVLTSGMIPVMYNQVSNKWVIADQSNENTTYEWYDYINQKWANAVLVTSDTRGAYGAATVGTEVKEEDILAYYVWIPRYKYVLFNTSGNKIQSKEIEVEFERVSNVKSIGSNNGEWLTHPAFTFGNQELSGIWVGKFETTGNINKPTIKPNVKSLRNQKISNQFAISQKFGTTTYLNMPSEVDSHMMKNTEWGAVAYLSHSRYGINNEICINNSSDFYTGRSGGNVGGSTDSVQNHYPESGSTTKEQYYQYGYYTYNDFAINYDGSIETSKDTTIGKGTCASTTGNVYGIYDMSGGANEYVMGVLADPEGAPRSGYTAISYTAEQASTLLGRTDGQAVGVWNSGFNGLVYGKALDGVTTLYVTDGKPFPNEKYYNLYKGSSIANNKILGDATGETQSWYGDASWFVAGFYPWFTRGGYYGNIAYTGIFFLSNDAGRTDSDQSFRVVLAPVID